MPKVNSLTDNGKKLARRVEIVKDMLGEAPDGPINRAVTELADVVHDLIMNAEPLWELEDT